ncbi:MAG: MetQ/NlpA family ABC transporter substrate-binding protein [Nostoc sp.]|uniref:MetQ/NlpA family ABC transporter substrate-binding protein n=1 Tax=Nostoc sp. TaxID=1180 RepID=UPI002FF3FF10
MSVTHKVSTGIKRRYFLLTTGSAIASTLIASCSSKSSQNQPSQQVNRVKIGVASVVPEDILKFIQKNLAPNQNLEIQIVKISDWVQINNALQSGEIDANFFQHQAYMQDAAKNLNLDLVILNRSYISVFGLYSKKLKIKSVNEVPVGATAVVHSDPINRDRGLKLLRDNGLINLKDNSSGLFTIRDAIEHPKKLQIKEVEGPAVVRALDDVDLGVTYATLLKLAKLDLAPILQAPTNDKKYATGLVTLHSKENDPNIQKLNQLFINPKVRDFINTTFKDTIIPVF